MYTVKEISYNKKRIYYTKKKFDIQYKYSLFV